MNYADMTVKELRELAAERGIKPAYPGNKAQLVIALEEADKGAAELTPEPETAPEPETTPEPETIPETETTQEDNEKPCYKTYVGPNIPGGLLTHGKILYGTERSIREFMAPVLERYPKVESLLVPMEETERAMRDVKNPKKLLYHKAQELTSETKRNGG
ncbi:MAG: SAP domain-containing protein [Oscillospiraceae bacterium]|nr:SAP domain-containing protein [Oscillospiraceae bacterium]